MRHRKPRSYLPVSSIASLVALAVSGCADRAAPQGEAHGDGPVAAASEALLSGNACVYGQVCQSVEASATIERSGGVGNVFDSGVNDNGVSSNAGSGTSGTIPIGDSGSPATARQEVMNFDLTPITNLGGAGYTIVEAQLSLSFCPGSAGQTINVHQATQSWGATTAQFSTYESAVSWPTFNESFVATPVTSFNAGAANGFPGCVGSGHSPSNARVDLSSLVTGWVNGTLAQDGILMEQPAMAGTSTTVLTSEYPPATSGYHPTLFVEFNVTCATGTADCNGNGLDGCETDITTTQNCGACGNVCAAGDVCQAGACVNVNPCAPNPCQNGGTCTVAGSSYTCQCPPGYSGASCQTAGAVQIAAGNGNTCALTAGGAVVCWGASAVGVNSPPSGTFTQISTGTDATHACALDANGNVACWGNGYDSDLGGLSAGPYTQVSANYDNSCALQPNGTAVCVGYNYFGADSPPADTFTQISAGQGPCGLKTDGTIACWGNSYGVSPPSGTFVQVTVGHETVCGIRTNGTLACWGFNEAGEASPPAGTFVQVGVGADFACGVKTDGTLACWGDNTMGQSTPPAGTFVQVVAGGEQACALAANGTVVCWGGNSEGQATPPANLAYAGGAGCLPGTVDCGGYCDAPLLSNCGTCGNVCDTGASCVAGACVCPGSQVACNGACVDLSSNASSCGACGNACSLGESCVAGTCACTQTVCGSACVDVSSSASNCGACGNACAAGQACQNGACVAGCPCNFTGTWAVDECYEYYESSGAEIYLYDHGENNYFYVDTDYGECESYSPTGDVYVENLTPAQTATCAAALTAYDTVGYCASCTAMCPSPASYACNYNPANDGDYGDRCY